MPYYQLMELNSRLAQRHKQDEGKCIQKYYLNPQYNNIYINITGD